MPKTNIQVRLPESVDGVIRRLPNRSAFIRAAITEKLQRDGLLHQGDEK
jgi:metal-responsive CopG/Arc/MetJ family transcriptional regulator